MAYALKNRPDRQADVLMTLHESGWMTNNEIKEEIGDVHVETVRSVTTRLERSGRIESRFDIRYPVRKQFKIAGGSDD